MTNTKQKDFILEVGVKALIKKSGKYLLLQRASSNLGEISLKWDIPGGRINPNEPFEEALKREIKEESNLIFLKIDKILAVQDIFWGENKHTIRITFLANCEGKVKINSKEHTKFCWLTLNEMNKLKYDIYLSKVIKNLQKKS